MIKIDDDYYIDADSHCYMLCTDRINETGENIGEKVKLTEGFYVSIEGCLKGYLKMKSREYVSKETKVDLKTAIEELEKIEKQIEELTKTF